MQCGSAAHASGLPQSQRRREAPRGILEGDGTETFPFFEENQQVLPENATMSVVGAGDCSMTAIFISHRSSDNAAAAELKTWLAAQGHKRVTAQPTPLPHIILNLLDYPPSAEN